MGNKPNTTIRCKLNENGIKICEFERYCGFAKTSLSRILAKEITLEQEEILLLYIEKMKNGEPSPGRAWDKGVGGVKIDVTSFTQFGTNVLSILKKKNMSMRSFAKQIGDSQSHLSFLLHGRYEPKLRTVVKIADALGVSIDSLVGRGEYAE